mgnify:CR=1 FL=1
MRQVLWVDQLRQDLRYALTLLTCDRAFTFVAALALALTTCGGLLVNRWLSRSASELFLWPLAIVVLALGGVRSAWLALRRGGIVWRETLYSIAALRAGRRVRFL